MTLRLFGMVFLFLVRISFLFLFPPWFRIFNLFRSIICYDVQYWQFCTRACRRNMIALERYYIAVCHQIKIKKIYFSCTLYLFGCLIVVLCCLASVTLYCLPYNTAYTIVPYCTIYQSPINCRWSGQKRRRNLNVPSSLYCRRWSFKRQTTGLLDWLGGLFSLSIDSVA